MHQNQQLQDSSLQSLFQCTLHYTILTLSPFTSSCLRQYPQTNQKVTKATNLALNCHTVYYPAFFFWLNMTFAIQCTFSYLFFHIWEIYKENWLPESVICDKYHRMEISSGYLFARQQWNQYFLVLFPRKGHLVYMENFKRLWLHSIVEQKYSKNTAKIE